MANRRLWLIIFSWNVSLAYISCQLGNVITCPKQVLIRTRWWFAEVGLLQTCFTPARGGKSPGFLGCVALGTTRQRRPWQSANHISSRWPTERRLGTLPFLMRQQCEALLFRLTRAGERASSPQYPFSLPRASKNSTGGKIEPVESGPKVKFATAVGGFSVARWEDERRPCAHAAGLGFNTNPDSVFYFISFDGHWVNWRNISFQNCCLIYDFSTFMFTFALTQTVEALLRCKNWTYLAD